jgi:hypothetical protein
MNIFIIIIMTLMFAAYQFFVVKRSADTVLDKDEMAFQIRLECLKQYHEYATSKNETSSEGSIMPADRPYNCTGAEDINMRKFCLKGNKSTKVDCNDADLATKCAEEHDPVKNPCGYHCVATTMPYTDNGGNMPGNIKSLVFKEGFYMIDTNADPDTLNNMQIPQENDSFGSASCVQAERIFQQQKLAAEKCTEVGKFIGEMKDDGTFDCLDAPPIAECTADEGDVNNNPTDAPDLSSGLSQLEACTQVGKKYCCAKTPDHNRCGTGFSLEWNKTRRHYVCSSNAATACADFKEVDMRIFVDSATTPEKSDQLNNNTYIPQKASPGYGSSGYNCIPNAATFTERCKRNALKTPSAAFNATSNPYVYAFNKVEGLDTAFASKAGKDTKINCHLTSDKSASATENCSACGVPVLDSTGNWKCTYGDGTTADTGSAFTNAATAISRIKAGIYAASKGEFSYEKLREKGCFKGCDARKNDILAGDINGEKWGLVWRADSKIWECFECKDQTHINAACEKTFLTSDELNASSNKNPDGSYKQLYHYGNCAQTKYSLCKIRDCNEDFQKMMPDGKCYTTWCILTDAQRTPISEGGKYDFSIGLNVGVDPNSPGHMNNRKCPDTHPTMIYNEQKDCVYCARVPPDIF